MEERGVLGGSRRTFGLREFAFVDTVLECSIELRVENVRRGRIGGVIGLDVFLDGLTTV